ncbi:Uncharacterised protein [Suttonella ornithocola]|uniref:Uncharacterized protein n=1 Tax=Suttonella ornithocola TaxID=279832 RepID=A0A380MY47_9GAMM|nr:Uncharacterised protein [Suttonella ornithocola]
MKYSFILFYNLFLLMGCSSVADLVGYDSQQMNLQAAQSYTQAINQAQAEH